MEFEIERLGLEGKPAPDMYREAASRLGVDPRHTAVIEDAISGVEAGKRAGAGLVIGVDRIGQKDTLMRAGADIVVAHLAELELLPGELALAPPVLEAMDEIRAWISGRRLAVFLDYDGTLTPIVARPELAILSDEMRMIVEKLSRRCAVAIISGRARADVEKLVALKDIVYAGSHGFDIAGPPALGIHHEEGALYKPMIAGASAQLRGALAPIPGTLIEDKTYTVAVHYRLVDPARVGEVDKIVDQVLKTYPKLRKAGGKKVYELRPDLDWDKGKAVTWLLKAMAEDDHPAAAFYIGDDVTDQDAFAALKGRGISILVADSKIPTLADYRLKDPEEVGVFLGKLTEMI